jgi:hypothetical protein
MKTPQVRTSVQVGNIEKISGEVNIAAGNIIKNIRMIYERSLTAVEEAKISICCFFPFSPMREAGIGFYFPL